MKFFKIHKKKELKWYKSYFYKKIKTENFQVGTLTVVVNLKWMKFEIIFFKYSERESEWINLILIRKNFWIFFVFEFIKIWSWGGQIVGWKIDGLIDFDSM